MIWWTRSGAMGEGRKGVRPVGPGSRARVTGLVEGLRRLADLLEAHQALYDPVVFEREASALAQGFKEFQAREPRWHRVPETSFRECRAAWLRAWQERPAEMERRCEGILGRLPHHVAEETEVSWRLHLLVEVLVHLGDSGRVLEMIRMPEPEAETGPGGEGAHVEDAEATEALLTWGEMTFEEFLLGWGKLDGELVRRCAGLVGVTMTRPSLAVKRKLHGLAVRMARNTRL